MRSLVPVRHLVVLLLAVALLAGPPLAAQPALTGPEILVDPASEVATQLWVPRDRVAATTDPGGPLMVVWIDMFLPGPPLRGRVFDGSGRPMGPAFALDTGVETLEGITLAPAAPEGFLLGWQTSERIGNQIRYRLFARRLSLTGQPSGEVIQIRGLVIRQGSPPRSMQIASACDGSFVAVWSETHPRTGREDVFLRRFDAAGRPLAKPAPLPGKRSNERRFAPSLRVLDGGEIRIAWSSRTDGVASTTFRVGRFDRNGAPLGAPVQLPPEVSAVTFGPDGGFLTTWSSHEGDVLHLRAYAPDGRPFPEHQAAVSFWGARGTAQPGGTFLIFGRTAEASHCAIAGLHVEAGGAPRGPAGCLTNPSGEYGAYEISATGTADEGFALFWSERGRRGEPEEILRLYGQRLAVAPPGTFQIERAHSAVLEGSPAPGELRILRRDGTFGTVSVEYRLTGAASGSGTVTFPDGDSTPRTVLIPVADDAIPGNDRIVRVALSRPTGGAVLGLPRRAVVEVRDDDEPSPLLARAEPFISVAHAGGGESFLQDSDLAASPRGDFQVAWGHSEEYARYQFDSFLQGVRFDAAAFPSAAFETPCSAELLRVRLAMHPEGDFMVFWQAWAMPWSPTEPYAGFLQRFDALGAAAGPVVSLEFLPDDAAPLPKGRFVSVGRGHDAAGEGLFAHFLSTKGIDRRSPVLLTREALQPGSPAAVATDAAGRSVMVWSVAPTRDGTAGLFARRFNALGDPLGPVFRVSQAEGGHDLMPSVATDVHGNFVVAWQRSWDGDGAGVYARAFDAAGTPLSDEIPVNSGTKGDQGAPSVALTGDGRFAVFWQSRSEVDSTVTDGVVGQLFAGDGTRLGSEALIDPDGGRRPTAVWSDRGYFVTIVCDYEESYYYYGDLCVHIDARRLPL